MLDSWRSATAPAAVALLVAAGGELNVAFGMLALVVELFVFFFAIALIVAVPVNLAKKRPFVPAIVGLVTCAAALVVAMRVVFGVPMHVKASAAPAIAAVEAWKTDHASYPEAENGSWSPGFPPELGNALRGTGCMYFTRSGKPVLGCHGVAFTKCDYDFETKTWRAWD